MAENLYIADGSKEERYKALLPQIKSLVDNETDEIANMANISAMLSATFGFFWTGFYRVVGDELVLGPFQGPLACTRIKKGRGVCGTAWQEERVLIVPDVDLFPGHIACSSLSRSEIVVPLIKDSVVTAVLDIDSENLETFDETDARYLLEIARLLTNNKQ
ncbi:MAG: GAF domain-containing protein [Muribaculaceae bacterium]|jgi:GAF domain-containing protein|nr:GAF domain-containing protein [Muribaculaceae bacterium]